MVNLSWDTAGDFDGGRDLSGFRHPSGSLVAGYKYDDLTSIDSALYSSDLVAWYPLSESYGDAHDLSGNGLDGTVDGAVQGVAGRAGLAGYSFSGSSSRVHNINGDSNISADFVSNGVSFATWIYPRSFDSLDSIIHINDTNANWGFRQGGGNIAFWYGSSGANIDARSNSTIPTNEWSHIGLKYDDSADLVTFFLNGQQDGTYDSSSGGPADFHQFQTNEIGSRDNDRFLDAVLVDARVYERLLSASEFQTLYDWGTGDYADIPGNSEGGISRWSFNSNANDVWGTNDGTVSGATFLSNGGIRGNGSYSFDGDNDFIDTGVSSVTTPFTIMGWGKPLGLHDGDPNRDPSIFSNYDGTNEWMRLVARDDENAADFGSSLGWSTLAGEVYQGDHWYHFAGAVDADSAVLYVNGSPVDIDDSHGVSDGTAVGDTHTYNIGWYAGTQTAGYWDGEIDDVRLYDRKLEPWEIAEIFQWGTFGRNLADHTVRAE